MSNVVKLINILIELCTSKLSSGNGKRSSIARRLRHAQKSCTEVRKPPPSAVWTVAPAAVGTARPPEQLQSLEVSRARPTQSCSG